MKALLPVYSSTAHQGAEKAVLGVCGVDIEE